MFRGSVKRMQSLRHAPSIHSRLSRRSRISRHFENVENIPPPPGHRSLLFDRNRLDWFGNCKKRCYTSQELNRMQMCCPCPDATQPPTCISVQQTPVIVCKKNIVWVQKMKHEPSVINTTKTVMVPKVMKVAKPIRVPEVIWTEGYIQVPKIEYRRTNVVTHNIRQVHKDILAPQEICTSFLCRPKPQYILIPPPTEYCCYSLDALNQLQVPDPTPMNDSPYKLMDKSPHYVGSPDSNEPNQNIPDTSQHNQTCVNPVEPPINPCMNQYEPTSMMNRCPTSCPNGYGYGHGYGHGYPEDLHMRQSYRNTYGRYNYGYSPGYSNIFRPNMGGYAYDPYNYYNNYAY